MAENERKFTVAMAGATGYAGQVMHALLMHHPCIEPAVIPARMPDDLSSLWVDTLAACDAVSLALPDDASRAWASWLHAHGVARTLDLSHTFRQTDGIHYGVPELFGAPPRDAKLVANPGCYPTATLLVLKPLLDAGLIASEGIAVLGASGASGAGKALADHLHFCNLSENFFPYKVGEHRHVPEIERHLGTPISFVTELLPIVRGMLVTAFVRPLAKVATLLDALRERYTDHPYVTVLAKPDQGLGVRHVVGTHQAVIAVGPVERSGVVPVFSSIDNLMKGAASQAVHNLNLWVGLDPYLGLPAPLSRHPDGVPNMTGATTWA